jgi:AraC-like DNA-binding protein
MASTLRSPDTAENAQSRHLFDIFGRMAASRGRHGMSWDFPRTPVASRHLLDTAEAHGLDPNACLAGTGLTATDLADGTLEVQAGQELAIVRNLIAQIDEPAGLGIEAGLRYTLANTGILGYALLSSPTMRDALTLAARYITLSSSFHQIAVRETAAEVVLELDASEIPDDVRAFLLERDLAAIAHVAPLLIGSPTNAVPVLLALETPDFPFDLRATGLNLVITTGAPRTAITLPAEVLDEPMPAADPDTAAMCIQQCEQLLERRTHRGGLSADVRARLIKDPADMPSMAVVAAENAITERTLHRRLAAENTSFRALVDEIREALAVELLANDLTVEEVGRRLGYSETAAFTHAFIRWRSHPPSHQRRMRATSNAPK